MTATNTNCQFAVLDFEATKKKMLNWANRFSIFCFLDNHHYQTPHHSVECLLAAGVRSSFSAERDRSLHAFQSWYDEKPRWLFGHLSYELKSEIEQLPLSYPDRIGFPKLFFFEPLILIRLGENEMQIITDGDADQIYHAIMDADTTTGSGELNPLQQRVSKEEYLDIISKLKHHILRGDCYEINYCMEFFAERAILDPLQVYHRLSASSPNPFSALYRCEDKYLVCASPERFLKKSGNHILSQPIKGTSRRFLHDVQQDAASRAGLYRSEKDRSENVMVVDLVRNDLSRVCTEGTVQVDELFGVYSFPQVHQMISTVSGELKEAVSFTDIIRATFPMGSMTGAPKKRVLELIDQYEKSGRGIFSGALGYITPEGDFDFNVIIRSIMYNASLQYISYMAGSGITFYSDAEREYEECMLKAEAMKKAILSF